MPYKPKYKIYRSHCARDYDNALKSEGIPSNSVCLAHAPAACTCIRSLCQISKTGIFPNNDAALLDEAKRQRRLIGHAARRGGYTVVNAVTIASDYGVVTWVAYKPGRG